MFFRNLLLWHVLRHEVLRLWILLGLAVSAVAVEARVGILHALNHWRHKNWLLWRVLVLRWSSVHVRWHHRCMRLAVLWHYCGLRHRCRRLEAVLLLLLSVCSLRGVVHLNRPAQNLPTLHLLKSAFGLLLVTEFDEAITLGDTSDRITDNFCLVH